MRIFAGSNGNTKAALRQRLKMLEDDNESLRKLLGLLESDAEKGADFKYKATKLLSSLRNGGCGRERNQNFIGQDYRPNCDCCTVVRDRIDDFNSCPLHDGR